MDPGTHAVAVGNDADAVSTAVRLLAQGGVVVYPTETLYGLGADALNPAGLQRIVNLKVRQPGKAIAVLISDLAMLDDIVRDIPPAARVLMRRFWPGPLTLVLPALPPLSDILTGGSGGSGVRISSHPIATALVRELGRPVTAPSANPGGQLPPVCLDDARRYFGAQVDGYLDGGRLPGEPASTVVDVCGPPRVIRSGAISADDLHATLVSCR